MVDATLGEVLGLRKANARKINPFRLVNGEALSFGIARNHYKACLLGNRRQSPHAVLDLDILRANIDYHKAHTIIVSFIGSKVAGCNIAPWLRMLNILTRKTWGG
jgi:hypothetical protein